MLGSKACRRYFNYPIRVLKYPNGVKHIEGPRCIFYFIGLTWEIRFALSKSEIRYLSLFNLVTISPHRL